MHDLVTRALVAASILGATGSFASAAAADRLGSYPIDSAKVSISGISSGAFMANQVHIAHSAAIMGAGLVAGGLYACAVDGIADDHLRGLASLATGPCMSVPALLEGVDTYARQVQEFASRGWVDPPSNLATSRVYLFTGAADQVVNSETVRRGAALYAALGVPPEGIELKDHSLPGNGAGHSWVTVAFGVPCDANKDPYINKCDYDQAEDLLTHIYGPLQPQAAALSGSFVEFDQSEFAPGGDPHANGLFDVGYLYVPKTCAPGGAMQCALHVVLHGCRQSAQLLGDEFYKHIGVNEWADSNNIVVLYPQARSVSVTDFPTSRFSDLLQINPEGCWNWWGYAYDDKFPLKGGVQVDAIWRMIERVAVRQP
jgi:poly(3-hydroxybutyrate) depolymerase